MRCGEICSPPVLPACYSLQRDQPTGRALCKSCDHNRTGQPEGGCSSHRWRTGNDPPSTSSGSSSSASALFQNSQAASSSVHRRTTNLAAHRTTQTHRHRIPPHTDTQRHTETHRHRSPLLSVSTSPHCVYTTYDALQLPRHDQATGRPRLQSTVCPPSPLSVSHSLGCALVSCRS